MAAVWGEWCRKSGCAWRLGCQTAKDSSRFASLLLHSQRWATPCSKHRLPAYLPATSHAQGKEANNGNDYV